FPDGKLSRKRWNAGQLELAQQFPQFASAYRELGWQQAIGSSGSAKAIAEMQADGEPGDGIITRAGVEMLVDRLLGFRHIDDIRLPGVSGDRRPVIAGGLLVMQTCFQQLGLEQMRVCETAM